MNKEIATKLVEIGEKTNSMVYMVMGFLVIIAFLSVILVRMFLKQVNNNTESVKTVKNDLKEHVTVNIKQYAKVKNDISLIKQVQNSSQCPVQTK